MLALSHLADLAVKSNKCCGLVKRAGDAVLQQRRLLNLQDRGLYELCLTKGVYWLNLGPIATDVSWRT